MKVTVSILKSNFENKETIKRVEKTDADYIHVDVMDGQFIPHHSLSIYEVNSLFENSKKPLDIHLMVDDVKTHIDAFKHLNVHSFMFHVETIQNIEELIDYIKSLNIKVGLAINPETQTDSLLPYLDKKYQANRDFIEEAVGDIKRILDEQKDLIFEHMERLTKYPILFDHFHMYYTTCLR